MNFVEKRITKNSHSGAMFKILHQAEGPDVLIKTFFSDIERSKKNINKQKCQEKITYNKNHIQAAPVLSESENLNTYIVKMAYIEGITAEKFLIRGSRDISLKLKSNLDVYLEKSLDDSYNEEICSSIFINKAAAVIESTTCQHLKSELIKCNIELLKYCNKNYRFPIGNCHGDLTLSNMIISNDGTINLIDYLETFFESPLQDVVKIMQDFHYGWSFRYESPAANLTAKIFCMHSTPSLFTGLKLKYKNQIKILFILTLMRIAPYVNDEITKIWLLKSLRRELIV